MNKIVCLFVVFIFSCSPNTENKIAVKTEEMMFRISEIEIDSVYLKEYISILAEESEASVKLEPGVISIYPMYQKENPTQISILEIYQDSVAYAYHLQTPHFKLYKTSTLHMVKSLKLIDMNVINPWVMPLIFKKLDKTQLQK